MERVKELGALNERDYDPMDVKTLLPGLEPWLRASPLVQSMQTLCAHDKTQLRFWLPAQCFKEGPDCFEDHLKRGMLAIQRPTTDEDDWAAGALLVECCIVSSKTITDSESAKVMRAAFRIYPQCAQCSRIFSDAVAERKVCAGCQVPFYCNVDCQKAHWPVHKPKCQLLRQTAGPKEEKKE